MAELNQTYDVRVFILRLIFNEWRVFKLGYSKATVLPLESKAPLVGLARVAVP